MRARARGFSRTVLFTRGTAGADAGAGASGSDDDDEEEEEETLEASWERMQRSLAAGRAQRMAVEMDMQVTRD